jgi:hypothetical protein
MSMIAFSQRLLDLDRHLIDDISISQSRTLELEERSDTAIGRLAIIRRAIAASASTCFGRLLSALDETRRIQTEIERARYRHLIDSE